MSATCTQNAGQPQGRRPYGGAGWAGLKRVRGAASHWRFAPGPAVEQAEDLPAEAVSARRAGRRVARGRARVRHVLTGLGVLSRDAAPTATGTVLRAVRRGRR